MSDAFNWDSCSETNTLPWDSGRPDRHLAAVEPRFELIELRAARFDSDHPVPAWACVLRKRAADHRYD